MQPPKLLYMLLCILPAWKQRVSCAEKEDDVAHPPPCKPVPKAPDANAVTDADAVLLLFYPSFLHALALYFGLRFGRKLLALTL
jgi:hypothetical protein